MQFLLPDKREKTPTNSPPRILISHLLSWHGSIRKGILAFIMHSGKQQDSEVSPFPCLPQFILYTKLMITFTFSKSQNKSLQWLVVFFVTETDWMGGRIWITPYEVTSQKCRAWVLGSPSSLLQKSMQLLPYSIMFPPGSLLTFWPIHHSAPQPVGSFDGRAGEKQIWDLTFRLSNETSGLSHLD